MSATRPPGPRAALRALGHTVAEMLRTRLELLAVEGAQLQRRLARLALLSALAWLALAVCAQSLAGLAVAVFWDTPHRLCAIAIVAAVFAAAAALCVLAIVRTMRAGPPALGATLRALEEDLDAFA